MPGYVSASMILLMAVAPGPIAAAFDAATGQPDVGTAPPDEMIDFLGRRSLCAEIAPRIGREAGSLREWRRLNCALVPAEEAQLRATHAEDERVLAALDRPGPPPRGILVGGLEPHVSSPSRVEWTGSAEGGASFHVVAEASADGRATRFKATINGSTLGRLTISSRLLPDIDLRTFAVSAGAGGVAVRFRYGGTRPWCAENDDGRGRATVIFAAGEEPIIDRAGFVNCNPSWEALRLDQAQNL